jgi:septum formation inhibitor MinC
MNQIERAVSKKELKNHEDVADVVISEIIHGLQDEMKEANLKINDLELELRRISADAYDEIQPFLDEKYKGVKENFNSILKSLNISGEAVVECEDEKQLSLFKQEGLRVCLKIKGHSPEKLEKRKREDKHFITGDNSSDFSHLRAQLYEYHDEMPFSILQSQVKLSFFLKFSESTSLPNVTKCVEIRSEMEALYSKYRELGIKIHETQNSKSKISTQFKRQTLEQNPATKEMLIKAKEIAVKSLSSSKLIGESK